MTIEEYRARRSHALTRQVVSAAKCPAPRGPELSAPRGPELSAPRGPEAASTPGQRCLTG